MLYLRNVKLIPNSIMTTLEIKSNVMRKLSAINDRSLFSQIDSLISNWYHKGKKTATTVKTENKDKEINVKEMTDQEFLDFFCSLPQGNPMPAEEYKKFLRESRVSGVTRKINYQAFYDAKISN